MNPLAAFRKKAETVLESVRGVKGELHRARAELERLKRRREDLRALPPPRQELADRVAAWVDARAAAFPSALRGEVSFFLRHPLRLEDAGDGSFQQSQGGQVRHLSLLTPGNHGAVLAGPNGLEPALFYLLREPLKTGFRKAIEEMPYPDRVAPPMPQRLAELKQLDAEIAELEAQILDLENALARVLLEGGPK